MIDEPARTSDDSYIPAESAAGPQGLGGESIAPPQVGGGEVAPGDEAAGQPVSVSESTSSSESTAVAEPSDDQQLSNAPKSELAASAAESVDGKADSLDVSAAEGPEELDEPAELDDAENVQPLELHVDDPDEEIQKAWYILKVQVNRENSICDALLRRVKVEGLERYFGEILVPTEDVREFTKTGKQRVVKRKLYPGYIVVNMAINDDTWFVVRETPGIGDFTGSAGKPTAMEPHEIARIIKSTKPDEADDKEIKTTIKFKPGDRVRVKEGYFQNFEGDVESIDEANGRITVMINIFGRSTPVELEHWQVEDI